MAAAAGAAEEELEGGVEAAGAAEFVVGAFWMGTGSQDLWGGWGCREIFWHLRNWGRNDTSASSGGNQIPVFPRDQRGHNKQRDTEISVPPSSGPAAPLLSHSQLSWLVFAFRMAVTKLK